MKPIINMNPIIQFGHQWQKNIKRQIIRLFIYFNNNQAVFIGFSNVFILFISI